MQVSQLLRDCAFLLPWCCISSLCAFFVAVISGSPRSSMRHFSCVKRLDSKQDIPDKTAPSERRGLSQLHEGGYHLSLKHLLQDVCAQCTFSISDLIGDLWRQKRRPVLPKHFGPQDEVHLVSSAGFHPGYQWQSPLFWHVQLPLFLRRCSNLATRGETRVS